MSQTSEAGSDDRVVKYLAAVCSNLQHNENMRNRLFQFYLIIAGSFLVVLQATNTLKLSTTTVFLCSLFVWVLGIFFLWAYERIREMIYRDNRILSRIHESLRDGSQVEQDILKEYETYAQVISTTSLKWWSLTSCIAFSTAIIAAVVLSVGFRQLVDLAWYYFGVLALLLATITYGAVKLLNLMARGKKGKVP